MKLYIYTLDKTLYEGEADVVILPSETGEITILPNHAPLVSSLKEGVIKVKKSNETKDFAIKSGFARINQDQTILLVK